MYVFDGDGKDGRGGGWIDPNTPFFTPLILSHSVLLRNT